MKKYITIGCFIVYLGSFIIFIVSLFFFSQYNIFDIHNVILFVFSIVISIIYYFISSSLWFFHYVNKIENYYEFIEEASESFIILKNTKDNSILIPKLNNAAIIKMQTIMQEYEIHKEKYYKTINYPEKMIIERNNKFFNFLFYIYLGVFAFICIGSIIEKKYGLIFMGLIMLFIGIFYYVQKSEKNIKIIIDESGIIIGGDRKIYWNTVIDYRISRGSRNMSLDITQNGSKKYYSIDYYDVKAYQLLEYIKHYKEKNKP